MSTRNVSKEYRKYSNNFRYFMDTYMFTDSNSEALSFLIWLLTFKSNINIGFVTSYMENGKQLIKTIFRYLDNLPQNLKPIVKSKTNTGFVLGKNVRFYVMSEQDHTKGKRFMYLFLDDFESFDKLKKTLVPAMVTKKSLESIHKRIIYLV